MIYHRAGRAIVEIKSSNNPTGKGGFQDHPELRNPGGWKKEQSIPYQQNRLMRMNVTELEYWYNQNKSTMTVAESIAYNSVKAAQLDIQYLKEVTDRTSGKARQTIDHTTNGMSFAPLTINVGTDEQRAILEAAINSEPERKPDETI